MNSLKLQETKLPCRNVLPFYALITNYQRKTIPFTIALKKNKIPRNKSNQGSKRPVHRKLLDTDEKLNTIQMQK